MGFPDLVVEVADGVAVVEMRRPPHNHFDHALVAALADECARVAADAGARVIVLCSEGRSFCAGAKLGSGSNAASPAPSGGRRSHLYEEAARLLDVPIPIIAAVQGAAVGGGFGLALMADLRVCSPRTKFIANFTALGIHPGFGLTSRLAQVIGPQHAYRLLLTGEEVRGTRAAELGLCDMVVADEDIRAEAIALAGRLAALAPLAVRSVKRTMRGDLRAAFERAIDREIVEQGWLFRTADHAEALRALEEHRPPRFVGE